MQYRIEAIDGGAANVRLMLDAADEADARRRAEAQGLAVVRVRSAGASLGGRLLRSGRGGGAFPLLHFNQSLVLLLRSGLSIVEAVQTLAERERQAAARRVIEGVQGRLAVGLSMSAALAAEPGVFPPLLVASVRANETTGALVEGLERFGAYEARNETLRKRLAGAAVYPALVLAIGGAVVAFLLLFVVPRFSVVFEDMGDRLPAAASLMLAWGRFVQAHGTLVFGSLALGVAVLVWASTRPAVRTALARAIETVPRIGATVRQYRLARFYRALGLLMRAGTPVLAALDLARELLPPSMQPAWQAARRDVAEGSALSAAFERRGLATPVARRLLAVAERTGAAGEMLERSAAFHDEEITHDIEWAVRLAEPLLMVGIGLVIGIVVLLMYAPIFELAGSLQ
jgi:general secretion pathway protein F